MLWLRRLLRLEPAVSLSSWVAATIYSLVTNWALIWATLGAIAVTWSAALSGYPLGSLGLVLTVAATSTAIYAAVSRGRLWNARRSVEKATERYIEARVSKSTVNPLDVAFTSQRIDFRDLIRPLTSEVKGKTFVRCQIIGPMNVVLLGSTNLANPNGIACEAVYTNNDVYISNAINIIDCDFRDCEFFNITFMVTPDSYPHFTHQILTNWITTNPFNYTRFENGRMQVRQLPENEPELPLQIARNQSDETASNDANAASTKLST